MTTYQDISANFRLSPQQRLCWLSKQPAPVLILDIRGTFDPSQWLQKLEAIVKEQETLRICLQFQQGLQVPLQGISSQGGVEIVSSTTESSRDNPEEQPVPSIRAELTRLSDECHQLRLILPALSADRGTLLRLAHALSGFQSESNADEEVTPYNHYSAWLYDLQGDEDAEEGKAFWAQQCPEQWQPVGLVYQQNTTAEAGLSDIVSVAEEGVYEAVSICDETLVQALESFTSQQDISAETVLMTAWAILLRRLSLDHTEQAITPLGWVHDCRRDYEELADTWGMFTRPLPLPWQAVEGESFQVAMERMQNQQEAASEWQEYYAVESDAKPEHSRFGFEWGNSLDSTEGEVSGLGLCSDGSISITRLQAFSQGFDLLLIPTIDTQGKLTLSLNYESSCYSEQAATVLLEQYQSLLLDALSAPNKPVVTLALDSATFNTCLENLAPSQPWPVLMSEDLYPALFSRSAQEHAELKAVLADGTHFSLSYRELETRSNQLAHHLIAQDMVAESRVALYLDQAQDMLVAMLAVMKSGAAFVPLEMRQPAARTLDILRDSSPDLVLCAPGQPTPALLDVPCLILNPLSFAGESALDGYSAELPDISIDPDQAAYLLFTSGSTGKPKGVVVNHRQVQNYSSSILTRIPLQAGEKSAIVTSLAADLSYTLLFTALLSGGELHLIDRETTLNPAAWAHYQQQHRIDHLKVVPSLLDAWLSHGDVSGVLPGKQLILGGESCKASVLGILQQHAPELQIYNHYGPTEATIGVMIHKVDASLPVQGLPLSERLDNTAIFLLDGDLQPVAAGMSGELYIAGANLSRGYLSEEQTAERFIPNPFSVGGKRLYRTGDLARYLPDGSLVLQGRADRQVKVRGYRVELDEIENLINTLPSVNQAAVVVVPRLQGDLQMFAFVTLKQEQQSSLAQLQGQLQDRLPDHMVPTLRLLDQLPLMANGKLNRQILTQQAEDLLKQSGSTPPRTALEATLVKLWAEVLGLESVGVEDDFFALGGHSLAAIKLTSRLQSALGMSVKVNMIFSAPSVAQFAQLVDGEANTGTLIALSNKEAALSLEEGSTEQENKKPKLFCFHPSTGYVQDYRHLPERLPQWQLWGLQSHDMTGQAEDSADSLTSMATGYLAKIREQQPKGPYYLLGWSLGGMLAVTAAEMLEQAGEEVAFLGVVDTRLTTDETAQTVEQLLHWAEDEFDSESRQRLQQLSDTQRQSLIELLEQDAPEQWPFVLLNWARLQGLQLADDSWQHAEERQLRHAYTQQLIRSFTPVELSCAITAWWAGDTLADNPMPADWQKMTTGSAQVRTIPSHHFNILQKEDWQTQIQAALESALLD
ncbi:non-ribosomal peptide synthetase [Oceanospirillum beijerinckii]|uniref:non-ribosomal peptide synthetase n=1 Tax=Oceanospirillum beijerinckii TaxID=64976 RepID=UPI00040B4B82|nr:non-ribosomal peptide synthetase [Oceanospirillum beijerinckii]